MHLSSTASEHEKCCLKFIFNILPISQHAQADIPDESSMSLDEQLEGSLVTLLGIAADETSV